MFKLALPSSKLKIWFTSCFFELWPMSNKHYSTKIWKKDTKQGEQSNIKLWKTSKRGLFSMYLRIAAYAVKWFRIRFKFSNAILWFWLHLFCLRWKQLIKKQSKVIFRYNNIVDKFPEISRRVIFAKVIKQLNVQYIWGELRKNKSFFENEVHI